MEVEIKYRLKDKAPQEVQRLVEENGGKFLEESVEKDTYFNVSGRDSMRTKECLRIRESQMGGSEITYKPPTENGDQEKYFAKKETNLPIQNADIAHDLLSCLGNYVLAVVEKNRKYYSLLECTVCIDKITNLGVFLEIEFIGEDTGVALTKIKNCAKILCLDDQDIVTAPYRDLVIRASSF